MSEVTEQATNNTNVTEPIEIALAVYDPKGTYSVHAGVTMTSIFEHTSSPVRVHILHDETLTDDNREKFLRTAAKYNQNVEFHDMTSMIDNLGADVLALAQKFPAWSIGTFFRIFIPKILNVARVIYLDCDILVGLDIRELWEIDMQDKCLAGVLDWTERIRKKIFSRRKLRMALMGMSLSSYVNAGVLMMNLEKIRTLPVNIIHAVPTWFARYEHLAFFLDQDFLNSFFRGSILFLPNKFNKIISLEGYDSSAVAHLTHPKPWKNLTGQPHERDYWKMYLKTAWGEDTTPEELMDLLADTASLTPKLHLHSRQCWQSIALNLKGDIFDHGVFDVARLLLREVRYWVTRPFRKKSI